jgi:hypothetical protein
MSLVSARLPRPQRDSVIPQSPFSKTNQQARGIQAGGGPMAIGLAVTDPGRDALFSR